MERESVEKKSGQDLESFTEVGRTERVETNVCLEPLKR